MGEDIRWELNELLLKYELEPQLEDVFVEGKFDQDILSAFIAQSNNAEKVIYDIGCVNVPFGLLQQYGLSDGNKQRVIALSRELQKIPSGVSCQCIVDKDLDHWIYEIKDTDTLIYTKYCAVELYFLAKELMHDIMVKSARSKIPDWDNFYGSFIDALAELYSLRLADFELSLCMKWVDIEKSLEVVNGKLNFKVDEYIDKLLHSNKQNAQKKKFEASRKEWKLRLKGDCRQFIRGHDLTVLIAWAINKFNGEKSFASSDAISRMLVLIAGRATELEHLVT